ncbi:MAG: sulfatase, partial [Planctomycetia bacterium]
MTDLHLENMQRVTRRRLFGSAGMGIGSVALAALLQREAAAAATSTPPAAKGMPGLPGLPHHEPRAKRVVMLWQGG